MGAKEATLASTPCFLALGQGVAPREFYTFHLHHILIFTLEVCLELFTFNGLVKSLHDMWRCLIRHKWTSTSSIRREFSTVVDWPRSLKGLTLACTHLKSHRYCFNTVRGHFPFRCTTFPLFFYVHVLDGFVWPLLLHMRAAFLRYYVKLN